LEFWGDAYTDPILENNNGGMQSITSSQMSASNRRGNRNEIIELNGADSFIDDDLENCVEDL